jgi:hypothetical protein
LPKARPISCNDSPAFQRRHMSVLCSAESLSRFPCVINTTFREMIHSRWCCIDRLSWHKFAASSVEVAENPFSTGGDPLVRVGDFSFKWKVTHWKSVNTSPFERSRWRGGRCACDTPDIVDYQDALKRLSPFSAKSLASNQLQAKVDSIPIA